MDYHCHNNILNILELEDQFNYLSTCRLFYYHLSIETLSAVKLKQNNITNHIFRNITTMDACDNKNVTDVSFMKTLKFLDASGCCGIDQNGIVGLNLVELRVANNNEIINVTFMKKLKILDASGRCGIDQNGINGLDLIKLYVNDNSKIINVSFMKKLKILNASNICEIDGIFEQIDICGIDQNS
jgi:hypothetical protein